MIFIIDKGEVNFEINEYLYSLMSIMISRGELYKREHKLEVAYLYLRDAKKIGKLLESSKVIF